MRQKLIDGLFAFLNIIVDAVGIALIALMIYAFFI